MTDRNTKYRCLLAACCAFYGPFAGPVMASWLWCATR